MRLSILTFFLGTVFAVSAICSARNTSPSNCIAFAEASQHVGSTECVSGTVLHVEDGGKGAMFLNFCKDSKACPFTVDRKSTRLNSSHLVISYAVFCLKKKIE